MASPGLHPQSIPVTGAASGSPEFLPSLFGLGYTTYPVRRRNFLYSLILHGAVLAAFLALIAWVNSHIPQVTQQVQNIALNISPYILPAGSQTGGGGGGGQHEKLDASNGALPKTARQQFTPPVVVHEQPKLAVAPTVVAPEIHMAPLQMGDPMAAMAPPSAGTGGEAGLGANDGTGIGGGRGPGVGLGWGGGVGGGAYRVGGGVTPPKAIYTPDPEYSEEARKAKYQGTVILWVVIGKDGRVHDVRVARSLGLGLDQKALEAVKSWKFEPGTKDGRAVDVQMNVEVTFNLY